VRAAVDELAPHLNRKTLVVGKSTVPVGTAAVLARRLAELAPVRQGAELAWNPEFLREGHAVADTLSPDRLVLGVESAHADAILRSVYAPLLADGAPCITTDLATAELVKVSANAFLATKISFINAIADICDAAGADVVTLATALGHDDRIGHRFLSAGLGYGGGCLPKDVRAFLARACELGVGQSLRFLQEVDDVNTQRRTRVVELARELVGGSFLGRAVAVLGAAFKPGSDDVRDSPALDVAADIQRQGGRVRVHDPQALDNARAAFPGLDYTGKVDKACEQADIVLHLTDWEEYSDLDPAQLAKTARRPYLLDGRNTLALDRWRAAGWTAIAMGRAAGGATSHRVT
jgi:UDPglucose 6-dehydrogenase